MSEGDRKEMISGKKKTWEDTMEKMMQKYLEEIAKLRVEIKEERDTWKEERRKEKEEWEKGRKQLKRRIRTLKQEKERKERESRKRNITIRGAKWVERRGKQRRR